MHNPHGSFFVRPVPAAAEPACAAGNLSPELAALSPDHRAEVWALEEAMQKIDATPNKAAACRRLATSMQGVRGWSYDNLRRKYYAWLEVDRDWRILIDKAKAPDTAREVPRAKLDNLYRTYCERHQRSNRSAWQALIRDIRRGVHFPGLGNWRDIWRLCYPGERPPAEVPMGWIPPGMTYRNFQRYAAATPYELTLARVGPKAARRYIPGVYSTRAGLLPGQLYQFDDMWHDILVAMPGYAEALVRPLEFACIDVASTHKIAFGMRPRIPRPDGTHESLSELEMLWLVCHVLTGVGFHKGGSVWCVEYGTAAIRAPVRKVIDQLTGGLIQYRDAAIIGKAVHGGMFDGSGKGNFRVKALIESSHRLAHYGAAMLPGQTGGNARIDRPEELDGMNKWAKYVLKATDKLPDPVRERLYYGGLSWSGYARAIQTIYQEIFSRTDHAMEGWEANEWIEPEWSVDGRGNWQSIHAIAQLPPAMQALAREAARTPDHTRMRRWSPEEVWHSHKNDLVRIPFWGIAQLLGMERAKTVTVRPNHLIQFQSRDLGPGDHRYIGVVTCPDGSSMALTPGQEYAIWVLPYQPDKALVACASSGSIIGVAPQWASVSPLDTVNVQVLQAAQARVTAGLNAPVIERHKAAADDRLAAIHYTETLIEPPAQTAHSSSRRKHSSSPDPFLSLVTPNAQDIQNEDW
ncbi:MAG: hypothetical protein M0Q49_02010 [Porticoccaceae bacterium]|nr:hypothetical protein [Porticoccaceae bacterium]